MWSWHWPSDLDMVIMYYHTKNEVSVSTVSKVVAWTDSLSLSLSLSLSHTHTHTHTHTMKTLPVPHVREVKGGMNVFKISWKMKIKLSRLFWVNGLFLITGQSSWKGVVLLKLMRTLDSFQFKVLILFNALLEGQFIALFIMSQKRQLCDLWNTVKYIGWDNLNHCVYKPRIDWKERLQANRVPHYSGISHWRRTSFITLQMFSGNQRRLTWLHKVIPGKQRLLNLFAR